MIAEITHHGRTFRVDLARPIDLSFPLQDGPEQLRAWWVDPVRMEAVKNGDTEYAVKAGSPVNFRNIFFNPHGHGTHVAGSVLGDGAASNGEIRGTAPAAQLFFQSIMDAKGQLGGLPLDLNTLLDEAYQAGARRQAAAAGFPDTGNICGR